MRRLTVLFSLALGFCLLPLLPAWGQGNTESENPVEIEADMLEVDRETGIATFSGSVRARQNDFRLDADQLLVFSGEDTEGNATISRLEASGSVLIDSAGELQARAQWAVFEVAAERIIMGDKVSLLQGGNIIEGGETVVNIKTGEARMRSGDGQRVRGLFVSSTRL